MTNAQLLQDAFGLVDDAIIDKAANTYVTKRRVNKWPARVAVAAAVIALVILIASSVHHPGERILEAKYYAIYNTNGEYALEGGLSTIGGGNNGMSVAEPSKPVRFMGLSNMRRIIFEGQLSDHALLVMRGFPRSKYGGVLLFDPNNMQDIVVPEGTQVDGLITWYGCAYQFKFSNDTLSGSLTYSVRNDSKTMAENMIQKEEHNVVILSVIHDPERNATETVFQYVSSQHIWKQVVYSVTQGNKTVTFVEEYWNGAEQQVPGRIDFWGTDNGHFFSGTFRNMTERPELEYLMQFGLKPYEDE